MNKEESLHVSKKFTSWTIDRVAEVIYNEWGMFNPKLQKAVVVYGKKVTQISFKRDVGVALEVGRQRYSDKDSVQMYFGLSLSPLPYNFKTHVLNTFDLADFVGLFPNLSGKHFFSIPKTELWNNSLLSEAAQAMYLVIKTMLDFESCFHLLLDDKYEIDGTKLDARSLSITHHLNQVKAYRLAEIYGHPEKLDEAVEAIKRFARIDELSKERLETMCAQNPQDASNWLYTTELLEKLGAS